MINLNKEQNEAIQSKNQFNLVIAGAGTGKTTVIVTRILKLLTEDKINSNKIALLTFSNKASLEMKSRVENTGLELNYAGTFHSISLKLINEYNLLGYNPTILEGEHKLEFFKESIKELQLKESYIEAFLSQIEKLKRNGLFYHEIIPNKDNNLEVFLKKSYQLYQEALIKYQKIDYEDMLLTLIENLKNNKNFKETFKKKFEHILIDEYQDSSILQLNLLKEIINLNNKINIFAVGDDDQSIYSFRDAKIENILRFEEYFKNARIIKLTTNYRSTNKIIETANSLIKNNKYRYKKEIIGVEMEYGVDMESTRTDKSNGVIDKKTFLEREEEYRFIVKNIKKLLTPKSSPSNPLKGRLSEEELLITKAPPLGGWGAKANEIAILFRYKYLLKELIAFLKEENIQFTTSLTDEEKIELELDNSGNGINLLTYHAAKGLEFNTVFLPCLEEETFLKKDSNIEEERRLFYVGITRAKENLYLSNSTTVKRFGQVIYANKLLFLGEI